ncbi:MAG TPA: VOC family protein [Pyrinomonadaceae bacterium]|jgi:catechol 2,3-dioxygenase-like lactoylglutathione lyase family enzyme
MIQKMSHATVYVTDQQKALEFYRDKLGFEVRTDARMEGGFRWLTVGPKSQPDFEIALMEPRAGHIFDEETAAQIRALVEKGALGAGVFDTDDCLATYEELKSKGVEFMSPPSERPYGIEALFKDNSGNWFSLTQHKEG